MGERDDVFEDDDELETPPTGDEGDEEGAGTDDAFDDDGDELDQEDTPPDGEARPDDGQPGDRPRDESGRFVPAQGLASAQGGRAPGSPDPQAPAAPAGTAPPEPTVPDDAVPFTFTANREPFHIPGSYQTDDGSFVFTPKAAATMARLAAAGQHHLTAGQEQYDRLSRELTEARETTSRKDAEATHILDFFGKLVQDPAEFLAWAQDTRTNWPALQAQAEAAALRAENERLSRAPRQQAEQQTAQQDQTERLDALEQAITGRVSQKYGDVGFTTDDLVPTYQLLMKTGAIFRANQDLVTREGTVIARKGQLVADWDQVDAAIEQAKRYKIGVAATAIAQRKAAEHNARRGGVRTPAPAARGARGDANGNERAPVRRARAPRSQEEADALLSRPVDEVNQRLGFNPTRRG